MKAAGYTAMIGLLGRVAAASPALANTIYCGIQDSNLDLKLAAVTDARGGQGVRAGSLTGTLQIYHQKQAQDRRTWRLEGKSLAQFWNIRRELKLRLFLGTDEESVDLTIDTTSRPEAESDYSGDYRFDTTDGVHVSGRVQCARD